MTITDIIKVVWLWLDSPLAEIVVVMVLLLLVVLLLLEVGVVFVDDELGEVEDDRVLEDPVVLVELKQMYERVDLIELCTSSWCSSPRYRRHSLEGRSNHPVRGPQ